MTQMKDIFSVELSLFDSIYIYFVILKHCCLYFPYVDFLHGMIYPPCILTFSYDTLFLLFTVVYCILTPLFYMCFFKVK